jgi:hypothetical protein
MFDSTGLESPLIGLMQYMWTGKKPVNAAPLVDSLNIDNYVRYQQIVVERGSAHSARVTAGDSDKDRLRYKWEIRPEAKYAAYAGQGELVPEPVPGLVGTYGEQIQFNAPQERGAYRIFVYVYDDHGHFSTGNLPFYVK